MDAGKLDLDTLFEQFDNLTTEGKIVYATPYTEAFDEDGFPVEFYVSRSLSVKPGLGMGLRVPEAASIGASPTEASGSSPTSRFGPGSDLKRDDKLIISTLNGTHLLIFNKFPVLKAQLLLLTTDSFRRQRDPLDLEDFRAISGVFSALDGRHMAFFNCAAQGGSSREHKHMQVIPNPGPFLDELERDPETMPFLYFQLALQYPVSDTEHSPDELFEKYSMLLGQVRQALEAEEDDFGGATPHNVIVLEGRLLVIPRRSNDFRGLSTAAPGMLGSVWLSDMDAIRQWREAGVRNVLSHLGLPKKNLDA